MAFSIPTKRSKSQDSPTFWLSLVAGSLLLHLVLLLLGRWYFSQAASAPAGLTQAPLDFVEIDPNAPPLKQAKPIAPSNTQTQAELPKAAPPQEPVTEATQAPNTIANLPRQTPERSQSRQITPERSQPRTVPSPSPSPTTPINQPNRNQTTPPSGQLPSDRRTSNPTPNNTTRPTPTTSPGQTNPTAPGTNSPGTTTPGTNSPGTTAPSPGSPSSTQPETPNTSTPETPGSPSSGDSTAPTGPGEPLTIATNIQGRVTGRLEEDPFRPEQFAKGTVTLKSAELPNIEFDFPSKLPVKTLDLRLGLTITQAGEVVDARVLDDSPTLRSNPDLNDPQSRADIQSIVNALILKANADGSLAFNVQMESKDVDAYRILNIQIDLQQ